MANGKPTDKYWEHLETVHALQWLYEGRHVVASIERGTCVLEALGARISIRMCCCAIGICIFNFQFFPHILLSGSYFNSRILLVLRLLLPLPLLTQQRDTHRDTQQRDTHTCLIEARLYVNAVCCFKHVWQRKNAGSATGMV